MTTVIPRGKSEQGYLNINLEKAPWRELGGILQTTEINKLSGALALRHFINSNDLSIDLWVGGLVADKAKLIDIAEWVFNIPTGMLSNLDKYTNGINKANEIEFALKRGVDVFREETKTKGSDAYSSIRQNVVQSYWDALEKRSGELIEICNEGQLIDDWVDILKKEMLEAYRSCVPHNTPRLIEAYAKGEAAMRRNAAKSLQQSKSE
jgi:hypothetical protein